jgi:diguanylate cyclase (GGDEF)-like protein
MRQGTSAAEHALDMDSRLPARALGSLYLAGATIGLVSLLLPHSPKADELGLYSNVALAYAGGLAVMVFAARLPGWILHAAIVAGSLLITRAVVLSEDPVSFYSVWFIWVGLYAFYFFTRAAAAAHVALIAILYALTLVRDPPSSSVARWLTTVATLIVAGVLIDTLVRQARRQAAAAATSASSMARVTEVAHELAGLSDSAAARPALCEAAARVTQADGACLWEPSGGGRSLLLSACAGVEPSRGEIPFAGPPAGAPQAFTTGTRTSDPSAIASRRPTLDRPAFDDRPGGRLWQPILREGLPVAVLELHWHELTAMADRSLIALTDLLAVEVAVTLERVGLLAELETIARTDELTGLRNRRAWHEVLPREMSRALRSSEPLCVAMLDLDHFKQYNDERGHQTGDRLLKQVAGAWSTELRPTDILARYGGEEFTLALPVCPVQEALDVVERLRAVMPDHQTCSAGIACWDGCESAVELLGRADDALYEAKRAGRNQTAMAEAGQAAPASR